MMFGWLKALVGGKRPGDKVSGGPRRGGPGDSGPDRPGYNGAVTLGEEGAAVEDGPLPAERRTRKE
ncbi:MAG: hypothetical protein ABR548_02505 [Actinomycetota bacterium]|nr:hypothetical protein [Actinomycetota bacterium]